MLDSPSKRPLHQSRPSGRHAPGLDSFGVLGCYFGCLTRDNGSFKGDVDTEVEVDIDSCCRCLKGFFDRYEPWPKPYISG